jgi:hypothetical protein
VSANPARRARRAAKRRRARDAARSARQVESGPQKGAVLVPGSQSGQLTHCEQMSWRKVLRQMAALPGIWYGSSPQWQLEVETDARAVFVRRLTVQRLPDRLVYRVRLDIRGPADIVEVVIVFYADPPYETYGLPAQDYPRVWAELGKASPHRMPTDDALCLWFPWDPPERRWTADKGLLDLLYIIEDHLLLEAHWRATGGRHGGVWAGEEAAHGFESEAA